jgi:hypothetical protein
MPGFARQRYRLMKVILGKLMFCLQAAAGRIGRAATLPLVERAAVSRALRLTDRRVRVRSGTHVRVLQPLLGTKTSSADRCPAGSSARPRWTQTAMSTL